MNTIAPRLVACAAAALMLAACNSAPSASAPNNSPSASTMPVNNAMSTLYAYHWSLERAVDANGAALPQYSAAAAQGPVRLTFVADEGNRGSRLSVANLCNNMSAGFALDGDKMRVSKPMSTMRACADRQLMALENLVGQQISTIEQWKLSDTGSSQPRLELRLADGSTWYLAGKPTDQTLYGSKPDRIFLEVAPQRVACNNPLMPNQQCLQVRTVQYADNGTKQSVGAWGPFYDEIKGYQHEAGVRNVLRVNRYARKNVPADASRYVYVLDMTVESEIGK